jgi:hypothetical protein
VSKPGSLKEHLACPISDSTTATTKVAGECTVDVQMPIKHLSHYHPCSQMPGEEKDLDRCPYSLHPKLIFFMA